MENEILSIILNDGDARAKCLLALRAARKNDFEKADKQLECARQSMMQAHKVQTELIQKEIAGECQEITLLMIHAQDHLMTAMAIKDMVIELIEYAKDLNTRGSKMIKKILLACSGGFSTSMLVQKMVEAARNQGLTMEILAISENNIIDHLDSDVLLLGPQIGHKLESLTKELNFPVFVIDMMDYGLMNGEKVLNDVLNKMKNY